MDIEVANAADILLADALAEVSTFNDGSLGSVGFKIHPLHCASLLLHPLTRSLQKLDNRTKVLVCRLGNAMLQKLISQTPTAREYDGKCSKVKSHLRSHLLAPVTRLYTQYTHGYPRVDSSSTMGEVTDV
jgi:hypothetical protein